MNLIDGKDTKIDITHAAYEARLKKARTEYAAAWKDPKKGLARQNRLLKKAHAASLLRSPEYLQAIADCSPVESDMWDVSRFLRASRGGTLLGDCMSRAEDKYAPFSPLAQHAWSALFSGVPTLREVGDPAPEWASRHHEVMSKFAELPEFQSLAKKTQYKPISSSLALLAMTNTLVELANELQDESPPPPPAGGGDDDGDDDDEDKDGEGTQPPLKPQMNAEQQERLKQAVRQAEADVDSGECTMRGCGVEPSQNEDLDPEDYLQFLKAINENTMKNMLEEIGHLGKIARATAKRIVPGFAGRGAKRAFGDRLDLVPDDILIQLGVPELEDQFLMSMCAGELPQCSCEEYAPAGRGPVVLCVDESGSMRGQELLIAKALAVATIRTAKEHNRHAWAVSFDTRTETHDTNTLEGLAAFMRSNRGGGTHFENAIKASMKVIDTDRRAKMADILLLTDGCARISSEFAQTFAAWKRRSGARLFTVVVGNGDMQSLSTVADHVIAVDRLSGKAPQEAFTNFWEHLADTPMTYAELEGQAAEAEKTLARK